VGREFLADSAADRGPVPSPRKPRLDEIPEAPADMGAGRAKGKLVVVP